MRASFVAVVVTTAILSPALALAQTPQQDLSRAGAGVGAAVGGLAGAAVELPADVLSAVTGAPPPGSVVVREKVVVGQPLPETVVLTPVPSHQDYSYAVVNNRRVVVEPRTRRVIRIIE
ncbi:MAG: DUF1236 domain-containing protein [Xanthobacteraceae bacterium]|nr:DUF1236 domain-containing protein [Xanthobacteraceae bacterium]MBV9240316.1 DUF1236 domain-containing protein [Xanthobacteraceae bacterium]MBV9631923.1 DUF1236 domain-containing protein [Xanthobacteraceae bacterium]